MATIGTPAPTAGFEFAYNLNGGNDRPTAYKLPVTGSTAFKRGDLVVLSSGRLTKAAAGASAFTGVMAEDVPSTAANDDLYAVYILQSGQAWRCSADAATQAGNLGVKTINIVDENTIDATPATGGQLVLLEKGQVDSAGNAVTYVVFQASTLTFA